MASVQMSPMISVELLVFVLQAPPSPQPSNQTSTVCIRGKRPTWSVRSVSLDPHQKVVRHTHTHLTKFYTQSNIHTCTHKLTISSSFCLSLDLPGSFFRFFTHMHTVHTHTPFVLVLHSRLQAVSSTANKSKTASFQMVVLNMEQFLSQSLSLSLDILVTFYQIRVVFKLLVYTFQYLNSQQTAKHEIICAHVPQMMNPVDFSDLMIISLAPPLGQNRYLTNTRVHDKVLQNLLVFQWLFLQLFVVLSC